MTGGFSSKLLKRGDKSKAFVKSKIYKPCLFFYNSVIQSMNGSRGWWYYTDFSFKYVYIQNPVFIFFVSFVNVVQLNIYMIDIQVCFDSEVFAIAKGCIYILYSYLTY